ncbi:MAG: hypothetical protein PHT74_05570, partial [Methanoculleus horonobensis]|nr:hypothetical protein [Methanoculleus horonobensis]
SSTEERRSFRNGVRAPKNDVPSGTEFEHRRTTFLQERSSSTEGAKVRRCEGAKVRRCEGAQATTVHCTGRSRGRTS